MPSGWMTRSWVNNMGWLFRNRGANILAYDTFTDTNGTLLPAHTPEIGGPWVVHFGQFTIQTNQAQISAIAGPPINALATMDLAVSHAKAEHVQLSAAFQMVVMRYNSTTGTFYAASWDGTSIEVYEFDGASFILRASTIDGGGPVTGVKVRGEANGDDIIATNLRDVTAAYASGTLRASLWGMRGFAVGHNFDDFIVTEV